MFSWEKPLQSRFTASHPCTIVRARFGYACRPAERSWRYARGGIFHVAQASRCKSIFASFRVKRSRSRQGASDESSNVACYSFCRRCGGCRCGPGSGGYAASAGRRTFRRYFSCKSACCARHFPHIFRNPHQGRSFWQRRPLYRRPGRGTIPLPAGEGNRRTQWKSEG